MQEIIDYFIQTPIALYSFIAALSLCVGSFLNVVILRTVKIMQLEWQQEWQPACQDLYADCDCSSAPNFEADSTLSSSTTSNTPKFSLSYPASHCTACLTPIRWYHNIPVLSWLFLRGQCTDCQHPISIRYPLIELLTLLSSLCVVYVFGPTLAMLCGLFLTWMLITLAMIDFDSQLLPDRFTLPLAAVGLALNSFSLYSSPTQAIWGYVIGFLSLWLVYYAFKLVTGKEGMGYGDFKLLAALGAWMGPMMLPLTILLSSLLGAIIGIVLLKIRKENIPFAFGPYIAFAGWIAFLWGEPLMKLYLG